MNAFDDFTPGADAAASEPERDAEMFAEKVAELAKLPPTVYEMTRVESAKALGVRVSVLDSNVAAMRPGKPDDETEAAPSIVEDLEPWDAPVNGAALADEIHERFCRHVTFAETADPVAATVWCFGTYMMDAWRLWPKVLVSSPAKRCGKTTLLEVMEAHVHRPFLVANVSAAAIFRTIEAFRPTFLIDEADTFLAENVEAGGILNAGHTRRTAYVVRLVGDNHEPQKFSVWCPQVIAGIGAQRDTLADRSIRIDLKRQLPGERKERLPVDLFERCEPTRRKLLRWAQDNAVTIGTRDDTPAACGNDRAQDNWTPLHRIAAVLGGDWPDRIRSGYLLKERPGSDEDGDDAAVMLLTDMHKVFEMKNTDKVTSEDMHLCLTKMEDRPWAEWSRGFPITKSSVARKVKAFGVQPKVSKIGGDSKRAYDRKAVEEAFARYIPATPPPESVTALLSSNINGLGEGKTVTEGNRVTVASPRNSLKSDDGYEVTLSTPPAAGNKATTSTNACFDGMSWDEF